MKNRNSTVQPNSRSKGIAKPMLAAVRQRYKDLFTFKTKEEELEHKAQMISYRFLSEVENECDKRKISRAELAEMVGTSRSYITQLFRGSKRVNMDVLAKFEDVLGITFQIKGK